LSTPFQLIIPRAIYDDMIAQARSELPNECCGILAGRIQESGIRGQESEIRDRRSEVRGQKSGIDASLSVITVTRRYALVNAAASPTEYLSDDRSLIHAHTDMRRSGLDMVAVYHSHPTTHPVPSQKDLERNYYGLHVMYLIISLQESLPQVRGWWLEEKTYREADWRLSG
jgi:[CysO sulfur-carrier protein]-S-L-cysteine hydrolase